MFMAKEEDFEKPDFIGITLNLPVDSDITLLATLEKIGEFNVCVNRNSQECQVGRFVIFLPSSGCSHDYIVPRTAKPVNRKFQKKAYFVLSVPPSRYKSANSPVVSCFRLQPVSIQGDFTPVAVGLMPQSAPGGQADLLSKGVYYVPKFAGHCG
jgi:hypothetical protein